MILNSTLFSSSPSQPRVEKLCLTVEEFLSCDTQPTSLWRKLLGILSSLTAIIPGRRLRMRSLQLCLHLLWDQKDDDHFDFLGSSVAWTWNGGWLRIIFNRASPWLRSALTLTFGPTPRTWGGALASGHWSREEALLSINARELLAVEFGLRQFQHLVSNSAVAVKTRV